MTGKNAEKWFIKNMDDQLSFYQKLGKSLPPQRAGKMVPRGSSKTGSIGAPVVPKIKNNNGSRITRKKTTGAGANTQLRRRGHTVVKIRRK